MIEQWETQEALDLHSSGQALKKVSGRLAGKVAGAPEVITLNALPAGDPEKGRLRI